jgi:micrococcal nuclease
VSYVVDGDTIHLEGDEKVRMVGVNTPELHSNNSDERRRAYEAKEFVENLCPTGTTIGLDVDDLEREDKYGRTLAVVYVNIDGSWVNLNMELLRRGYAEVLYIPPSEFNPYKWI